MITRVSLLAIVVAVLVAGCSLVESDTPTPTPSPPSPTPDPSTLWGSVDGNVSTGIHDSAWYAPPVLIGQIYYADVIVRARFESAKATTEKAVTRANSSNYSWLNEGVIRYHPKLELTFNVIETLKGTSGQQITVTVYGDYWHGTAAVAQDWADEMLSHRDSRWDNREAILFVEQLSARDEFNVTGATGVNTFNRTSHLESRLNYMVDSDSEVSGAEFSVSPGWHPVIDASAAAGTQSGTPGSYMLSEYGGTWSSFTVADILAELE